MSRYEEIKAGGAKFVSHMNMGHAYAYGYVSIAEPRIKRFTGGPKGKSKAAKAVKPYCIFQVDGVDGEFTTLEEAVIALEKMDEQAKRDKEWEDAERAKVAAAHE